MDATLISSPNVHHPPCFKIKSFSRINYRSNDLYHGNCYRLCTGRNRNRNRISAIGEVSAITSDPIDPQITWQIIVGSIGIEFSKRIVAQKQCEQCGGSGLVLMKEEYIRCPNCGGFLPWQSWKRFFSG